MQYVWPIWSLIIIVLWVIIWLCKKDSRKVMLKMSFITMAFGLTEPYFVPEYWNPPSLFNLAQITGFDIESFIFSFAIGGIGCVIYRLFFKRQLVEMEEMERIHLRHKLHSYLLLVPIYVVAALSILTSLNHIYCGIIAMFTGALATLYCRPDLKEKIWIGGFLFTLLYFIYFGSILLFFPGYVKSYWNLEELTYILIAGIPLEELLFAFSFGMYWSSLYEHLYWKMLITPKTYHDNPFNFETPLDSN